MTKTSNAMWGGRFAAGPDAIMEAINASIGFDKRLAAQDIAGSRAHAAMLAATGIVSDSDAEAMREGLLTVLSEIEEGRFEFSTALEDIHMNVEARLKEVIGESAGRLHTGRSRNDQVATDFKLWVREQLEAAESGLVALIEALLEQAGAGAMPEKVVVTIDEDYAALLQADLSDATGFRSRRMRIGGFRKFGDNWMASELVWENRRERSSIKLEVYSFINTP